MLNMTNPRKSIKNAAIKIIGRRCRLILSISGAGLIETARLNKPVEIKLIVTRVNPVVYQKKAPTNKPVENSISAYRTNLIVLGVAI